jgi:hypothetical protein
MDTDLIKKLIQKNNDQLWDWITWETLGNPDDRFRKGDVAMKFGLWRADYFLLCRKGGNVRQPDHPDKALGRGWVKIDVLPEFDYRKHEALIKTFLPFMTINQQTGELTDPLAKEPNDGAPNKYWVVMPYNYDDNSDPGPNSITYSKAVGTRLYNFDTIVTAHRLKAMLQRWSTASRSGICRVLGSINVDELYDYLKDEPLWPFRKERTSKANIFGGSKNGTTYTDADRETTYTKTLSSNDGARFYSVKTGVQYVGSDDQSRNNKDNLEANSLHAMKRSNLIEYVRKGYAANSLKARYQIEILCVQLKRPNDNTAVWDGFQVRDIDPKPDEVWFPALAIPGSGKAFAKCWGKQNDDDYWVAFWRDNFAKPLGRAKGEMLAFFGLQHQTANAQNMLIAFNKKNRATTYPACLILRDLGDTLLNDHVYAVLKEKEIDPGERFKAAWDFEASDPKGITLTHGTIGGGYADPLMTRVGSAITFFSPPFRKHDLHDSAAKTLATWGIATNEAFLAYFKDEVGYTTEWQQGEVESGPTKLIETLKKYAADMTPKNDYSALRDTILKTNSKTRQYLVFHVVEESKRLQKTEPEIAKKFVGAHDMLISAEVECYLKSEVGKKNLRAFHKNRRKS